MFVEDLDGDGDPDLVAGGREDRAISVWMNRGDGILTKAEDYPVERSPVALAGADLDADGWVDLLSVNGDGSMSVFVNQGNGLFIKEGDYFVGPEPAGIFVGDLDRDGDMDVAVPNRERDEVSILFNRTDRAAGPVTSVPDIHAGLSTESEGFRLDQNCPNPFNAETTIRYTLSASGMIDLVVYDVSGHAVRTLVRGQLPAGVHRAVWDGRDDKGIEVSSGVYLYRLRIDRGGGLRTRKTVLIR